MKKHLITVALMFFINLVQGQQVSILSPYSSVWNQPYYTDFENSLYTGSLNKDESEFFRIVNLLRKNPRLFMETVILPYASKKGYSNQLMQLIEKMKDPKPMQKIDYDQFYNLKLRAHIDSVKENIIDSANKNKYSWPLKYSGEFRDMAEALCRILNENTIEAQNFRERLMDSSNVLAISISPDSGKIKNIHLRLCYANIHDILSNYGHKSWGQDWVTNKKLTSVSYGQNNKDSILEKYIRDENLNLKEATYFPYEKIISIKDSLIKAGYSFTHFSRNKNLKWKTFYQKNKNGKSRLVDIYTPMGWSSSSISFNWIESEEKFNYYFLGWTKKLDSTYEIIFENLVSEGLSPRFKNEEIGYFPGSIRYISQFNSVTKRVPFAPVKELAIEITKPYKSELDKVAAIYQWINHNITYDYAGLQNNSAAYNTASTLRKQSGVCSGQANLFMDLCNAAGIMCHFIIGQTPINNPEGHAWNAVCVNGKWYLADVTWGENYFLIPPEHFFKDHFPYINKWNLLPEYRSFKSFKSQFSGN